MKIITKDINNKLFKQYPLGSNLEKQVAVAKIFNPYGDGRWFLLNSDPEDPDYIWAIVQMHGEVEMGSISRKELESLKVGRWKLPLERDLGFQPINALKLMEGLREGKFYKDGGWVEYAMGGAVKWQDAQIGDSARVIAENKTGLIMQAYGRKFHLKFVDGSEKTYDAKELEFIKDEYADGGEIKKYKTIASFDDSTITIYDGNLTYKNILDMTNKLPKNIKTIEVLIKDEHDIEAMTRWSKNEVEKVFKSEFEDGFPIIYMREEDGQKNIKKAYGELKNGKKVVFNIDDLSWEEGQINMAKGGKIVGYEVEYERVVDGERERDIKSFKTKEEAEKFAKENYGYVQNVYEGQYDYAKGGMTAGRWYKDKSGKEYRYIGESSGKLIFNDGEKVIYKDEVDFEEAPKEKKIFGIFKNGGETGEGNQEMLKSNLKAIKHHVEELEKVAKPNTEIEAWVLSKSERAETDLSDITHYLDGLKMNKGGIIKKSDIVEGAKFNLNGNVFVIESVKKDGNDILVVSSLEHGKKGAYRDTLEEAVAFLNEEGAVKIMAEGGTIDWVKDSGKDLGDGFKVGDDVYMPNRKMNGVVVGLEGNDLKVMVWDEKGKEVIVLALKNRVIKKNAPEYAKGGDVKFADKVKSIKKSLLKRKKVSPKVQKDYGKTYSPKEAEQSAKRIVGAMTAKERLLAKRKKK